jgi:glycosyltransferase involved in cell wall biosynthesis
VFTGYQIFNMISVVMASYLGWYKGAASNRSDKFCRAVESFINQQMGELIIVSDGCNETIELSKRYREKNIKVHTIQKQPIFSGYVRQYGISMATNNWVCYLDTGDEFLPNHLKTISDSIDDNIDWFYFDDIVNTEYRNCLIEKNKIGTSCIAHKKNIPATWPNGYGHDWEFIKQLGVKYKKIQGAGYKVNHIPKQLDI